MSKELILLLEQYFAENMSESKHGRFTFSLQSFLEWLKDKEAAKLIDHVEASTVPLATVLELEDELYEERVKGGFEKAK